MIMSALGFSGPDGHNIEAIRVTGHFKDWGWHSRPPNLVQVGDDAVELFAALTLLRP